MKKVIKITGIILAVILILLISVPFIFKDQINEAIKTEINKSLNAKVGYSDFSLGLISSFPDFKFTLKDLYVAGINEFEGDTLLQLKAFSIHLDLMSVIKMTDINIKRISLDNPIIYALILPNGKANWDIVKPSNDTTTAVDTAASETKFNLLLKKFEIINADITYDDQMYKMFTSLQNFNFLLKGDFSEDFTSLDITSNADVFNFVMEDVKYLKDASMKFDCKVDADLVNSVYTLKDNSLTLNDLVLGWNGTMLMKEDDIVFDMTYAAKQTTFKSILSFIPAIYMQGYESVKTEGNLKLDGFIRGTYNDKKMPNVGINLLVENGMFKYPDLPKSVDNIAMDIKIFYDGVQDDNTTIDVNKFHFEISKNPFDIVLNLKTPMSDPFISAKFSGGLDFASLRDVMPLDSVNLKGSLKMDLELMGQQSMIDKEQYDKFKANGSLQLQNIEYSDSDFPDGIRIAKAAMEFSPQLVTLSAFEAVLGKTDISMQGQLSNFIPYALSGKTLKGTLNYHSNILDLNQFMTESETPETTTVDTTQTTIAEVPKDIDFELKSSIGQLYYDQIIIKDLVGVIKIIDGKVLLEDVDMNMLEGSMKMSGEYNTQNLSKPFVNLDMKIKDFDIPSCFVAFNTVKTLAPIAENAKGRFSMGLKFSSLLDQQMGPVMSSIVGEGTFASQKVEVVNSKALSRLADAMKYDKMKDITLNDVKFDFEIKDGRIYVDPFETNMGTTKMKIEGDNGLDQTIRYVMNVAVPRSELGAAANQVVSNLAAAASEKGINIKPDQFVKFNVNIGNLITDPKVTIDLLSENTAKSVKDQAKQVVTAKVDEAKNKAKAAASKEAEKILATAQQQADAVKANAAKLAEQTKKEAYANAAKIESEASKKPKPLKDIAKKAADKVRKEGDDKANAINSEGNQKADAIMQKARAEAAKLTN